MLKLKDDLKKLVMDAYYMGYEKEELIEILEDVHSSLKGEFIKGGE